MTRPFPRGGGAIVTVPPHADFIAEVAAHPRVVGLRLNTVMPTVGDRAALLRGLAAHGQPVWVDLKGRQLRVVEAALPPFTAVRVSHRVRCPVPADAFFSDGQEHARVVAIDGDRLILADSPRRVVGPGESVNLLHPEPDGRIRVEGSLTESDRAWLAAMAEADQRRVMLSFVEGPEDSAEVRALLPGAEVVQKIESRRGLAHARSTGATHGQLMAARGDLYVEVRDPHRVIGATADIVRADPQAIAASRLLSGLAHEPVPACAELSDLAWLHSLGYRSFMLGDHVCLRADTIRAALHLLDAVLRECERIDEGIDEGR